MELKDGDYRVPVRGKTTRIHYMELKAVRLAIGLMCIVLQESITWSWKEGWAYEEMEGWAFSKNPLHGIESWSLPLSESI